MISNPVAVMASARNRVHVASKTIVGTDEIFNRTVQIINFVDFSLNYLFANELAPSLTPLFLRR